MSRIHEALQRAGREQHAVEHGIATAPGKSLTVPIPGEHLLTLKAIDLERVPTYPWSPSLTYVPTLGDRGESIEQFRSLRSRVYEFHLQNPLKTIVVSSGMPGEGKTFVAANLAVSLARNKNQNVLLIDGDLRRPSLHGILGAPAGPGLAEYLTGAADLAEIIQRNEPSGADASEESRPFPSLFFIGAGKNSEGSAEFLASYRVEEMMTALSAHFSWIIIDSPPALVFADAVDLARTADAVLLVARGASTPYDVAQRTQAAFATSRVLGFVLNAVRNAPNTGSYYYYGRKR